VALARHDELVEQVVTSGGGRLIKTRGEGDATFSVFERPSAAAAAAIELQEAIRHEPWALAEPVRIRIALHTGEVELRDGDYFGRAVNRAARLRSLAAGGQILCSGATAELVIDSLRDDVLLADLGMRQLKNLARPEHVFELRLATADDSRAPTTDAPMERPGLPAVLIGPGPFVGRTNELDRLRSAWQTALAAGTGAVLIAGEPGVGKTRLAGEWCRQADDQGAIVLYGRCDEDLGAPYQPFAEALRSLVPCLGANRVGGLRGVEALLPLVPGLSEVLPDLAAPPRADPDTERYALFDAVIGLLGIASASAPVVLILDDLHWATKPTLLLLRHLLRFGEHARVQIVGTYRSTDLDRSHPLAAMLADLHRDGTAHRLTLSGLDENDVTAYVAEAGYDDEELARALASVTGGNPFFLIEALRHVDESGGRWDPSTLPQGVREAVSRRLSRLPAETNKALAAAAVVGSRFALDLVERVVDGDLVDAFDEACKAGIVVEEPGGRYRFNHAIVRQSLLAELSSVRRMRLHQRIAATLETEAGADDELLAELAYHYFECAWAGNAAKAVDYCRRAADQAMARLAYEGAADLYDKALHALEELDDELPDRDDQLAGLLVARCEALLAAGDVVSARGAVLQLQTAAADSARLVAWGTCFDGQLSMLTDPERLDEIESALVAAAEQLVRLEDAAGEAKAHTVRAGCLARLGRIGDAETALDQALTAARRAREHRRVNSVLANAPLAALWGPNPVPRAGGRCLDVVRLLRITTGSPVVEATSTRCQGVLDAFRGRAAAGRQLIDSARRSLTELGMRHALLEVEQFAGIVELVADDPASAEPHLRRAYNGFRRMGLDADTAETAALLARACLALDRDAEADELCTESERLAGHALKASIAWRTVRAQLLARGGTHDEARQVAEEAVAIAERTDALVDHGDACLALATVLGATGDVAGAQAAAERAVELYELKGAAALAEKARGLLSVEVPVAPADEAVPSTEPGNLCVRVLRKMEAVIGRDEWDEFDHLYAADVLVESRRRIVGFTQADLPSSKWPREARRLFEVGGAHRIEPIAVRGERLALTRLQLGTADTSPGAPRDESLNLFGLDDEGRIAIQVVFDVDDLDAAIVELDAAHARFERRPTRASLENAASRADDRLNTLFADRRWDEIGELFADNVRLEDRRRGLRNESNDRATAVAAVRAIADIGTKSLTPDVLAVRGKRLALARTLHHGRDTRPDAFHTETLTLTEINADGLIADLVAFDSDDLDAAFEELEARYLAGEAVAHAHTWSVIANTYAAFNQGDPANVVNVDHRRVARSPGDLTAAIYREVTPNLRTYVVAVHRLNELGVVVTGVSFGTSPEGFKAEWRQIQLLTVKGNSMNRTEIFDESDLDAALAKFDELSRPTSQLENATSQVYERLWMHFKAGDWPAVAELFDENMSNDDRRRVVNAGVEHGRDVQLVNLRRLADIGADVSSSILATRGQLLILNTVRTSNSDLRTGEFDSEMLNIIETDSDGRIVAGVLFDADDLDAAFAELDARYLAGEGAAHADTWSVIAQGYALFNRHQPPLTTPDWVTIDHRQLAMIEPGAVTAYLGAIWELTPDEKTFAESVHRLTNIGAVVTQVVRGTSREGFDAEWRVVLLATVEGDRINRCEFFDEADLDAALVRLDELRQPAGRLENAASQMTDRFLVRFAARDWDAVAQMVTNDISFDDRRRVVNAGLQVGRDLFIENFRIAADLGATQTSNAIATRGDRVVLARARFTRSGGEPEEFGLDLLHVVEIDADERIAATVTFDPDDLDAAFAELDARYLAGEGAAHAHTWSVIANANAAFNRHEMPPTTPDWANIDHRRVIAFAPGDMAAYIRATWDVAPGIGNRIVDVHRLSDIGAVFTQMVHGTSQEGFDAEWRDVALLTVEGDLINRIEAFDEEDLDAALARFDALSRQTPRLENAAARVCERSQACYAAADWDAVAEILAHDCFIDDRRRVVNAGFLDGRDAVIPLLQALADGEANITWTVIAIRGERLVLTRIHTANREPQQGEFVLEMLGIGEIDTDDRIAGHIVFDPDDIDTAFAELDTRYLAGEAAGHARTWSVVSRAFAALNRRELAPTTPDWAAVSHRRLLASEADNLTANIRAAWDLAPTINNRIEAVHRLNDLGAVVTHAGYATSHEGADVEVRLIDLFTVEGDLISRCELFDEEDLDAALARFDELSRRAPRLENAASRVTAQMQAHYVARDWAAIADLLSDDTMMDDRRHVVNVGRSRGRDIALVNMRAASDAGTENLASTVIATRGERLVLGRFRCYGQEQRHDVLHTEFLAVTEIDTDNRIAARVIVDLDDIATAYEELDARYLAGEAGAHAHTWSLVAQTYAGFNRRELLPTVLNWQSVDHRRGIASAQLDAIGYAHAAWDTTPDTKAYVETVHRLSNLGAVVTAATHGTSQQEFSAEWRDIHLMTFEGDLGKHFELFDEADLDTALARFDELSRPARQLDNAVSRLAERFAQCFATRDWDALAEIYASDFIMDDRRRIVGAGVRHSRDAEIEDLRVFTDVGFTNATFTFLATRGERLALTRMSFWGGDSDGVHTDILGIAEVDADGRITAAIAFDPDDTDAAFAELDARYAAGEAAPHAHTWSLVTAGYAALNRHEAPATTADWVNVDNRRVARHDAGDLTAAFRATWDVVPDIISRIVAVHRLSDLGSVVTHIARGTSQEGFAAEWQRVVLLTVDGDLFNRAELFDESDLDVAVARFDELNASAPQLQNTATRTRARMANAFNDRNLDGLMARLSAESRYEDRRKGLRDEGSARSEIVRGVFEAPKSWRQEVEPIAIRGSRLGLTRERFRDISDADRPITAESLTLTAIDDTDLICYTVHFDPDDINGAFAELTSRWIASGEVAHPEIIEALRRFNEAANRHEWDELATIHAGAMYINHRQLASGADTAVDDMSSMRMLASLIPDMWVEAPEFLTHSARGVVIKAVVKGTSTEGGAVELPWVILYLFDGDRVTHTETFDADQRDSALARFEELNRSSG